MTAGLRSSLHQINIKNFPCLAVSRERIVLVLYGHQLACCDPVTPAKPTSSKCAHRVRGHGRVDQGATAYYSYRSTSSQGHLPGAQPLPCCIQPMPRLRQLVGA